MGDSEWLMRIEGALSAHFFQADGSSRPGTDWSVGLKHGDQTYNVTVRAYLSSDITPQAKADEHYQGQTVIDYLYDCIENGWHPERPAKLAITIQNPNPDYRPPKTEKPTQKPRWRFW